MPEKKTIERARKAKRQGKSPSTQAGEFVRGTRERLCALMPAGEAILLEILRFGHELRSSEDLPFPAGGPKAADLGARERAMAEQLIGSMLTDWDPSKYKDRYHDDVMKLIDEKAKTGTATVRHVEKHGEMATDVIDLLDLLKKSVASSGKPGPKKAGARRHSSSKAEAPVRSAS